MKRVLVTGAAGGIGSHLRRLLPPIYPGLVLSDMFKPSDLRPDEKFIEAVASEIDRRAEALEDRLAALQNCLAKLPDVDRNLVLWRYYEDCGIDEIAAKTSRSTEAVYQVLCRIRQKLSECINRQISHAHST